VLQTPLFSEYKFLERKMNAVRVKCTQVNITITKVRE